jgi:hypothetical protein
VVRFNPAPVLIGHWRGLSNVDKQGQITGADYVTRCTLVVVSGGIGGLIAWKHVEFAAPTAFLSGFALLSGVLLGVFAQLASMRLKLTEQRAESNSRQALKDSLDEAVAHVLVAATVGLANCVIVVIAMSTAADPLKPVIAGVPAILVGALGTYELLLLVIVIRQLYSAYVRVNKVSDELSGFSRAH